MDVASPMSYGLTPNVIYPCPKYFTESNEENLNTLLHEMTHIALNTQDVKGNFSLAVQVGHAIVDADALSRIFLSKKYVMGINSPYRDYIPLSLSGDSTLDSIKGLLFNTSQWE